jgi:hypothetical protein
MTGPVLVDTRTTAVIHAPMDAIDLTEWVFTLTDMEYQSCSKDHIAAAVTMSPTGQRMSINVEHVGQLLVQHYVEAIAERHHCRLVSETDAIGPDVNTVGKTHVLWEFWVEPVDDQTTEFTNRVEVRAADGWEQDLLRQGTTFQHVAQDEERLVVPHIQEETPLFARDIERKALTSRWGHQ